MKKLLTWLASIALTGSTASTVVSCFTDDVVTIKSPGDPLANLKISADKAVYSIQNQGGDLDEYEWGTNSIENDTVSLEQSANKYQIESVSISETDKTLNEMFAKMYSINLSTDKKSFKININNEMARRLYLDSFALPNTNIDGENLVLHFDVNISLNSYTNPKPFEFVLEIQGTDQQDINDLAPDQNDNEGEGKTPGTDADNEDGNKNPGDSGTSGQHEDNELHPGKPSFITYLGRLKDIPLQTNGTDEVYTVDTLSVNRENLSKSIMENFIKYNGETFTIENKDGSKTKHNIKDAFTVDESSIQFDPVDATKIKLAKLIINKEELPGFGGSLKIGFTTKKARIQDHIIEFEKANEASLEKSISLTHDEEYKKELETSVVEQKLNKFKFDQNIRTISENDDEADIGRLIASIIEHEEQRQIQLRDRIKKSLSDQTKANTNKDIELESKFVTKSELIDQDNGFNEFNLNYKINKTIFENLFHNNNGSSYEDSKSNDLRNLNGDNNSGMLLNPSALGLPNEFKTLTITDAKKEFKDEITKQIAAQVNFIIKDWNKALDLAEDMFTIEQVKIDGLGEDWSGDKVELHKYQDRSGDPVDINDDQSVAYGSFVIKPNPNGADGIDWTNFFNSEENNILNKEIPFYLGHKSIADIIKDKPNGEDGKIEDTPGEENSKHITSEVLDENYLVDKNQLRDKIITVMKKEWPALANMDISIDDSNLDKINTGEPDTWIDAITFGQGASTGVQKFSFDLKAITYKEAGVSFEVGKLADKVGMINDTSEIGLEISKLLSSNQTNENALAINGKYAKADTPSDTFDIKNTDVNSRIDVVSVDNNGKPTDLTFDQFDKDTWKFAIKVKDSFQKGDKVVDYSKYILGTNNEQGIIAKDLEFDLTKSKVSELLQMSATEASLKLESFTTDADEKIASDVKKALSSSMNVNAVDNGTGFTPNKNIAKIITGIEKTNIHYVSGQIKLVLADKVVEQGYVENDVTFNVNLKQTELNNDIVKTILDKAGTKIKFNEIKDETKVKEAIYESVAEIYNIADDERKAEIKAELNITLKRTDSFYATFTTQDVFDVTITTKGEVEDMFIGQGSAGMKVSESNIGDIVDKDKEYNVDGYDFWDKLNDTDDYSKLLENAIDSISKEIGIGSNELAGSNIEFDKNDPLKGKVHISGSGNGNVTGDVDANIKINSTTWTRIMEGQTFEFSGITIASSNDDIQKEFSKELTAKGNGYAKLVSLNTYSTTIDDKDISTTKQKTFNLTSTNEYKEVITKDWNTTIDFTSDDHKEDLNNLFPKDQQPIDLGNLNPLDTGSKYEDVLKGLEEALNDYIDKHPELTEKDPNIKDHLTIDYSKEQFEKDLENGQLSGVKVTPSENGKDYYKDSVDAKYELNKQDISKFALTGNVDFLDGLNYLLDQDTTNSEFKAYVDELIDNNYKQLKDQYNSEIKVDENGIVTYVITAKEDSKLFTGSNSSITTKVKKAQMSDIVKSINTIDLTQTNLTWANTQDELFDAALEDLYKQIKANNKGATDDSLLVKEKLITGYSAYFDKQNQIVSFFAKKDNPWLIGDITLTVKVNKVAIDNLDEIKDKIKSETNLTLIKTTVTTYLADKYKFINSDKFEKFVDVKFSEDKKQIIISIKDNAWLSSKDIAIDIA